MDSPSKQFFDGLRAYPDLEQLIQSGESENLFLEVKAPTTPLVNRDLKATISKAISGFANTAGGVLIFGISTTKHEHSGLDVLTQLEPIGNCTHFAGQIRKVCSTLTVPAVTGIEVRILKRTSTDTRGVVVTYIPKTDGDPIQAGLDSLFYFRSGDEFVLAPYEMIKRLFAATESPDLRANFKKELVLLTPEGVWEIPIIITNLSSAIAEHCRFSIAVNNPLACDSITLSEFKDVSNINPGRRIFMKEGTGVVHRGLDSLVGTLAVKMRVAKRPKRVLKLTIQIFANKMRARSSNVDIVLAKKAFAVAPSPLEYLY